MPRMRDHLIFVGLLLVGGVIYFIPISSFATLVRRNETYSHIPLIPLVTLFLVWTQRTIIFAFAKPRPALGTSICAGGLLLYVFASIFRRALDSPAFRNQDVPNDYLTLCMAGAVAWIIGSFITIYGATAFKKARFGLLFLLFAIPIPMFLLNRIITSLQYASAEASDIVFQLTGAPYHRVGLVFEFPNVTVEVAEQCSGIRSSLSLFILSIISGFLFLRTLSRRVILALAIFPITVVKNAFRIATVTLLANYVDMRFLTNHWIHSSGGMPFFVVGLAMFIPLVWILRKSEGRERTAGRGQRAAGSEPEGAAGSGQLAAGSELGKAAGRGQRAGGSELGTEERRAAGS